jgi:hypothetical protein
MNTDPSTFIARYIASIILKSPLGITDLKLINMLPPDMQSYIFREKNPVYFFALVKFLEVNNIIRMMPYFPSTKDSKFKFFPASYFLADSENDSKYEVDGSEDTESMPEPEQDSAKPSADVIQFTVKTDTQPRVLVNSELSNIVSFKPKG